MRVAREAGSAALGDGLLTAAVGFVMAHSRSLSGEVGAGQERHTEGPGAHRSADASDVRPMFQNSSSPALSPPQVLASLHCLLSGARFQPCKPLEFGNAVVERLLRLARAQQGVGLNLKAFADVVRWGAAGPLLGA